MTNLEKCNAGIEYSYADEELIALKTEAILGALEPLTAVLIGLLVFNEPFTAYLAIGIVLILAAVMIIALAQQKKTDRSPGMIEKKRIFAA
jgi:threonine/homoserine efflux transporter RhtA